MHAFIRITIFVMGVSIGCAIVLVPYLNQITAVAHKDEVKINDQIIVADVVKDQAGREAGLSGRDEIGINEGMLFLYDEPGIYGFWMKGMKFPIDIVWVHTNSVVGFVQNVDPQIGTPDSELKVYYPPYDIDRVLELKAGRTQMLRLKVGDTVRARPLLPQ
jgi:uncharacterized membrane protein (UPF0127 family)